MLNRNIRGLLFDLDGTLLDSFSVHFEAYRVMFSRFGIEVDEEKFLNHYSPNWYHTYEALGLSREVWNTANIYWREEVGKMSADLLPGTKETLTELSELYTLGLVTSGSKSRVMSDLERTGIASLFRTIVTGDDIRTPKPSPEGLEIALKEIEIRPDQALYVGDAQADYEMACAANVLFVGISSAFNSPGSNQPYPLLNSVAELIGYFKV